MRRRLIPALLLAGLVAPAASAASVQPEVGAVSHAGATALAVKPRAVVSGSFLHLPSGQLRVSVGSSARRVRLTWRTAANLTRSTTVMIRNGAGSATLAGGSSRVVARALATPRLRPSVRAPLRPNPWLSDVDGNGIVDYSYDGVLGAIGEEAHRAGYFETVALDADRDGRPERLFYDGDRTATPSGSASTSLDPTPSPTHGSTPGSPLGTCSRTGRPPISWSKTSSG